MTRTPEGLALLLEAADPVEVQLARGLLEEAGIPSLTRGPDFDVAELGRAAHDSLRGTNLYVPEAALAQARATLEAAWGEGRAD